MENAKWIALLLGVTAIWGTTFPLMKDLLGSMDTFALLSVRFSIAAVLYAVYLFGFKKQKITADEIRAGSILGIALFFSYGTQTLGLNYTSATNSAFITGLFVILIPLLSAIILRKVPERKAVAAVIVGLAGLALLTNFQGKLNLGDAITLLTALGFALHIILTVKYAKKASISSLILVQIAVTALLSFAVMFATAKAPPAISMPTIASLLFLAVFATVIANLVQTSALAAMDPTKVGLILITEPIFAALFSFIILHETLALSQGIGAILIFAGMFIAESNKIKS